MQIPQHLTLPSSVSGDTVVKLQTVDIMTAADPTHRHVARAKEVQTRLFMLHQSSWKRECSVSQMCASYCSCKSLGGFDTAVMASLGSSGHRGWQVQYMG